MFGLTLAQCIHACSAQGQALADCIRMMLNM